MSQYTIDGTTYDSSRDVADAFGMSDYNADDLRAIAAMPIEELIEADRQTFPNLDDESRDELAWAIISYAQDAANEAE